MANLFLKKIFGVLQSTQKVEARDNQLLTDLIHYKRFEGSEEYAEYKRLFGLVNSPEFKERRKNRKKQTAEQLVADDDLEAQLRHIAESEDGKFFLSTNPRKFRRIENLVVYKKDNFEYKNLDDSLWKAGFYYTNPKLLAVHSLSNELQANMGGKNVVFNHGLSILTKKAQVHATAWGPKRGFEEREFQYTSDVVNGCGLVTEEYCGIRIKMRCSGKVNHAFWLSSGEKIPQINVALIKGKTIEMGVHDARGDYYYTRVKGLNPSKYYIYSIYQKDGKLIWKINNITVFKTKNIIAGRRFFPCLSSFIPDTQKNPSEGRFDVEWIEVYR